MYVLIHRSLKKKKVACQVDSDGSKMVNIWDVFCFSNLGFVCTEGLLNTNERFG